MKRNKINQSGFSFIEITLVILGIIFLVAVVAYTYDGIKARSRNDIRTADIKQLQVYVETFYSQNTFYPSRADLNSPSWRATNIKDFSLAAMTDPLWTSANKACSVNNMPILLKHSEKGCYGYNPTNNGVSCEKNDTTCDKYTLSASLEDGGGVYIKTQLD